MVSIAESLIDTSLDVGRHDRSNATPLLRGAIDIFQKCLSLQRERLQEVNDTSMIPEGSTSNSTPPSDLVAESETEQRWAMAVETVTSTTLLDTCLARAHAWTILIPLLDPHVNTYQDIVSNSMGAQILAEECISTEEERMTCQQTIFNFEAVLADYAYKSQIFGSNYYVKILSERWLASEGIHAFGPALCDYADALVIFSTSVASEETPNIANVRWQALSTALKSLAQANTNPGPADRIAINARRGDVELLRTRLGEPPVSLEQAKTNRAVMIKNAETYYLGARKLALAENDALTAHKMLVKSVIATAQLEGNMKDISAGNSAVAQKIFQVVIGEMAEEGLIRS